MRDLQLTGETADHFLNRPAQRSAGWLVWFVFITGGLALAGFLGLLAFTNGLL